MVDTEEEQLHLQQQLQAILLPLLRHKEIQVDYIIYLKVMPHQEEEVLELQEILQFVNQFLQEELVLI